MAQFQVTILGCGSATPTPRHNPSAQIVDYRGNLFMIDCGEGAQSTIRRMRLSFSRISHIFLSHMHGDHCFGLPGLLSTLDLHAKGGSITVHLPAEGVGIMRSITDYFCNESTFEIIYDPIKSPGGIVCETPTLTVEAFPLYHRVPCFGYIFREKPKQRHLRGDMVKFYNIPISRLQAIKNGEDFITDDGRVIPNEHLTTPADPAMSYAYCSDTLFDQRVAQAVKGVTTIYHEATYDNSMAEFAHRRGHSTATEAAKIAAMAGAQRLIIGHFSQRYSDTQPLVDEARTHRSVYIRHLANTRFRRGQHTHNGLVYDKIPTYFWL